MLVQTERFGTPIAHALGQFAETLRMRRAQAAEEVAARSGAKLLFPLVLFIFPSILVVTIGQAILGFRSCLLIYSSNQACVGIRRLSAQ
jgi:tight adherence protein C